MKKFYRIQEGKVVWGFCAGLARYFNIDPILIRLVFVFLVLGTAGLGILFYIVATLLTPMEQPNQPS